MVVRPARTADRPAGVPVSRSGLAAVSPSTSPPLSRAAARPGFLHWGAACAVMALLSACAGETVPTEVEHFVLPVQADSTTEAASAQPVDLPTDLARNPAVLGQNTTRRALARAIANDPRPLERAALVNMAVAEVRGARGGFYPQLSLSANASSNLITGENGTPALSLTARQMLVDFGGTDRDVARKAITAGLGHLDFLDSVDAVLQDALTEASELSYQRRSAALTRGYLQRLSEIADLQAARDGEGFALATDRLDVARAIQGAESDLARISADEARAARRLTQLTGESAGFAMPLTQADCRASGTPIDVLAAQLTQAGAAIGVTDAERARWPSLVLEGTASQPFSEDDGTVGVNLRLDTALFSGNQAARRAAAAANLAAAGAAEARAREATATAQGDALADLGNLSRQMAAEEREIAVLGELQALYFDQYTSLGTRSLSDLLDLARETYQAERAVLATKRDMDLALVTCVSAQSALRDRLGLAPHALHGLTLTP